MHFTNAVLLLPALAAAHPALSHTSRQVLPRGSSQFSQIVAFGDELSDNGNGSYAHGVTGNPALVYGYGTWTNGPVAVSYLSTHLGAPLLDYAFGGCCGAGKFGATISAAYTPSDAGSPCVPDQITNYTSTGSPGLSSSLAFMWAGQNDLSKHTDAFWLGDSQNANFATNFASITAQNVQTLINAGAQTIMVANIYPKHLAPVTTVYLCGTSQSCIDTWGQVIQEANSQLQSTLASLAASTGVKIIYYDSFGFLTNLMANKDQYGFTESLSYFCDGDSSDPNQKWDECWDATTYTLPAPGFFWVNYVQPTTEVYRLMGRDMAKTVRAAMAA